jgi:uncharacterized membrane protein
MEETFREIVGAIALAVEAGAALFIAIGALEALYRLALNLSHPLGAHPGSRKRIWVRFAVWLLLALEFELAADVLRTTIAPSWDDIGQLASIAVIRTFLNYFLEKDIEKYGDEGAARTPA